MVVRLACFAQAHEEDVTVFISNLILSFPAQNLSKNSLTCSSKSSRLRIRDEKYGKTQREIYYMYCCPGTRTCVTRS